MQTNTWCAKNGNNSKNDYFLVCGEDAGETQEKESVSELGMVRQLAALTLKKLFTEREREREESSENAAALLLILLLGLCGVSAFICV